MNAPSDWPKTVTLKCEKCGATQPAPMHCGKPMAPEKGGKSSKLVCWMGASCGAVDIPKHHGKPMKVIT